MSSGAGGKNGSAFTPVRMLGFFTAINMLNYLDRGIIPGASEEFNAWIEGRLGEDVSADVYLGLLQSGFIAGYAVASTIFGHLVHRFPPFKMMGLGLYTWIVAVMLCALAKPIGSYWFLFGARVLSGVGEASFQCIAPPFIDDNAPTQSKAKWLGIFFMAIPVGTALGYGYGTAFATSSLHWAWAFIVEGLLMVPLATACFFVPYGLKGSGIAGELEGEDADLTTPLRASESGAGSDDEEDETTQKVDTEHLTMWEETKIICSSSIYVLTCLGYAAYTGVLIGLSTYAPAISIGLGFFDSETGASFTFGAVVSVAGVIGTPLGGWLLDRRGGTDRREKRTVALLQLALLATGGSAVLLLAVAMDSELIFFGCMFVGTTLLMATTAGITFVILASVPTAVRSFAVALQTMCIHALGDVPAPIAVGAIKDGLAPHCEEHAESDECRDNDQDGLRVTMVVTVLWLIWTVLTWWAAYFVSRRSQRRRATLSLVGGVQ